LFADAAKKGGAVNFTQRGKSATAEGDFARKRRKRKKLSNGQKVKLRKLLFQKNEYRQGEQTVTKKPPIERIRRGRAASSGGEVGLAKSVLTAAVGIIGRQGFPL